MSNLSLLQIAVKNLRNKSLRSTLTILGVVIGVAAVFFLLSFGLGVQQLVNKQVIGSESLKTIDVTTPNAELIKLNNDMVIQTKSFTSVQSVGVQYNFPGIIQLRGGEADAVVYGSDIAYQDLTSLNVIEGRLLTSSDTDAVVINKASLTALGISDPSTAIGQKLSLNVPLEGEEVTQSEVKVELTIIGVIDSSSGNEVIVLSSLFDGAGIPGYTQAKVSVKDLENLPSVRAQLESGGYQTESLSDTLLQINNIFRFFNLIVFGFGSVGMIVAILGMFNTITITLLERTKESALMMALGARRSVMHRLFLFESILIAFLGSMLGVLLALGISKLIDIFLNIGAASRGLNESFSLFATPVWMVFAVISVTVLLGILISYFPALRAAKADIVSALRRD